MSIFFPPTYASAYTAGKRSPGSATPKFGQKASPAASHDRLLQEIAATVTQKTQQGRLRWTSIGIPSWLTPYPPPQERKQYRFFQAVIPIDGDSLNGTLMHGVFGYHTNPQVFPPTLYLLENDRATQPVLTLPLPANVSGAVIQAIKRQTN